MTSTFKLLETSNILSAISAVDTKLANFDASVTQIVKQCVVSAHAHGNIKPILAFQKTKTAETYPQILRLIIKFAPVKKDKQGVIVFVKKGQDKSIQQDADAMLVICNKANEWRTYGKKETTTDDTAVKAKDIDGEKWMKDSFKRVTKKLSDGELKATMADAAAIRAEFEKQMKALENKIAIMNTKINV